MLVSTTSFETCLSSLSSGTVGQISREDHSSRVVPKLKLLQVNYKKQWKDKVMLVSTPSAPATPAPGSPAPGSHAPIPPAPPAPGPFLKLQTCLLLI